MHPIISPKNNVCRTSSHPLKLESFRTATCESLLFLHGFKPEIAEHEEIFQNITSPQGLGSVTTEDDIKRYESAIIQLKDLFRSE